MQARFGAFPSPLSGFGGQLSHGTTDSTNSDASRHDGALAPRWRHRATIRGDGARPGAHPGDGWHDRDPVHLEAAAGPAATTT